MSNFVVAAGATIVLLAIKLTSPAGQMVIEGLTRGRLIHSESLMVPLCVLFHVLVEINVLLAVFNLLPVPPLDGSHVVRHLLPDPMRRVYDMMGFAGLMLLVYFGGGLLNALLSPVLSAFDWILLNA